MQTNTYIAYIRSYLERHTSKYMHHQLQPTGTHPRLSAEGSLRADAWALQALRQYEGGKLIQWAWVSRGLVTLEKISEWHHGGDMEAATDAMSRVKGAMHHLYNLDEIPSVDPNDQKELVAAAESSTLEGELHQFWAISDPDEPISEPIPLPSWFHLPIDNVLLTWKREHFVWEERKAKREAHGYDTLAPKMKKKYDQWLASPTRLLVLDKKRKAQVVHPAKKSQSHLKKTCLLLVLHPSMNPADLWIRSGEGKQWRLRLLEGQKVPEVGIPEVMDHFSGWL